MSLANSILQAINEMAYDRTRFCSKLRDDFLGGSLQEFTCRNISVQLGKPDNWSNEVGRVLNQIHKFIDKKEISTTFKDREKALKEAMKEASLFQDKITSAKSKIIGYYPELRDQVLRLDLSSEEEFAKMIKEFLPKYSNYLG